MGGKLKEFFKRPIVWIVIAGAGVAYLIYSRAQAAGGAPAPSGGGMPYQGGGGGGGTTDTGAVTSNPIQDQIDQIGLQQAQETLRQSAALFNFNLQEKQNQAGIMDSVAQAWANLQSSGFKNVQNIADTGQLKSGKGVIPTSCQHGDVVLDPMTGLPTCRTPEGGGFKPFQSVGSIFQGALQGVANIAPNIAQGWLAGVVGMPQLAGSAGTGQSQRGGQAQGGTARTEQGMNPAPSGMTGTPFPGTSNQQFSGFPAGFPGMS